MSSAAGKGLLLEARKELAWEWSRAREVWSDANAARFEERYIQPIDGHVRRALEVMDRLADAADAARRDCEQ